MPSCHLWVPGIRRAGLPSAPKRAEGRGTRADSSSFRPLSLYPLADKGLGPVGDPYPCTLWPFRRLATYPSYPNRVGHPCPRTSSKFLSLATYPLGLGGVRAVETLIFFGKRSPGGLQSLWPNQVNLSLAARNAPSRCLCPSPKLKVLPLGAPLESFDRLFASSQLCMRHCPRTH